MINLKLIESNTSAIELPPVEALPDVISYSAVSKWDTCQRQFYYSFSLGLRPVEAASAITTGTKGHKLMQLYYTLRREGVDKEAARKRVTEEAQKLMKEESLGDRGVLQAWSLVDNYIRGTEFVGKVLLVENRFLFPVSKLVDSSVVNSLNLEGVQIGFTPDVVFERNGGLIDVEDSKFIQRAWTKKKINRFVQAKLYSIFLKRMGYNVSRSAIRFFNVTTGDVTSEVYTLNSAEEENIINDFVRATAEVVAFRRQPLEIQEMARRTFNYPSCQFCAYEFPCTLQAQGKDATKTFDAEYVKSDYDYRS